MYSINYASRNNSNYLQALTSLFGNVSSPEHLDDVEISSGSTALYNISTFLHADNYISSERFVNLAELIDYKYKLTKPLAVKIIREESDFIGEVAELDIYAFGGSEFEVLREINKDVTELFEEILGLDESQLGNKPLKWKKILSEYIQKDID